MQNKSCCASAAAVLWSTSRQLQVSGSCKGGQGKASRKQHNGFDVCRHRSLGWPQQRCRQRQRTDCLWTFECEQQPAFLVRQGASLRLDPGVGSPGHQRGCTFRAQQKEGKNFKILLPTYVITKLGNPTKLTFKISWSKTRFLLRIKISTESQNSKIPVVRPYGINLNGTLKWRSTEKWKSFNCT